MESSGVRVSNVHVSGKLVAIRYYRTRGKAPAPRTQALLVDADGGEMHVVFSGADERIGRWLGAPVTIGPLSLVERNPAVDSAAARYTGFARPVTQTQELHDARLRNVRYVPRLHADLGVFDYAAADGTCVNSVVRVRRVHASGDAAYCFEVVDAHRNVLRLVVDASDDPTAVSQLDAETLSRAGPGDALLLLAFSLRLSVLRRDDDRDGEPLLGVALVSTPTSRVMTTRSRGLLRDLPDEATAAAAAAAHDVAAAAGLRVLDTRDHAFARHAWAHLPSVAQACARAGGDKRARGAAGASVSNVCICRDYVTAVRSFRGSTNAADLTRLRCVADFRHFAGDRGYPDPGADAPASASAPAAPVPTGIVVDFREDNDDLDAPVFPDGAGAVEHGGNAVVPPPQPPPSQRACVACGAAADVAFDVQTELAESGTSVKWSNGACERAFAVRSAEEFARLPTNVQQERVDALVGKAVIARALVKADVGTCVLLDVAVLAPHVVGAGMDDDGDDGDGELRGSAKRSRTHENETGAAPRSAVLFGGEDEDEDEHADEGEDS